MALLKDFFGKGMKEAKKKKSTNTDNSLMTRALAKVLTKSSSLLKGSNSGRDELHYQEFDLQEIRRAMNSDSYLKVSSLKYSYMLFKAGYSFKSINEKASDYVNKRFKIMGVATGKPIDILLQEVGDDLIRYSNAFLIKSRVDSIMPGIKAKSVFTKKVVGGYFRVSPEQIICKKDKQGNIAKYVQILDGEEKEFNPIDVVHFYLDKDPDNFLGTPRINAALEDVKILRVLEGHVIAMIHRFSMPLFHWKIGAMQQGFQATKTEIDEAKEEIEYMSIDGSVVTNEKTDIKVVGAEGSAINADGYLKYFEERVFTSLGVSSSQMGRGGTKQDADSMESQAHDTVKHIQRTMSIFTENFMINEILLEGGFNPILNKEDEVSLNFYEINLDTKIKVENHEMAKYQSNMITTKEMRKEIGKPEEFDEKDLYKFKIEVMADKKITENKTKGTIETIKQSGENALKLADFNAKQSLKMAKLNASNNANNDNSSNGSKTPGKGVKSSGPAGNGTNKSSAPNKDISNKNTPENQHGKTSVKVKEASSNVIRNKKRHEDTYESIYDRYDKLAKEMLKTREDEDISFPLTFNSMNSDMRTYISMSSFDGIDAARKDISKIEGKMITLPNIKIEVGRFEEMSRKQLKRLQDDIKKKIDKEDDIASVFEGLKYRLRFMIEFVIPKVYWYSYLKTGQELGFTHAKINFNGSEDAKEHKEIINLKEIDLDKIPPFHSFCDCTVEFIKGVK